MVLITVCEFLFRTLVDIRILASTPLFFRIGYCLFFSSFSLTYYKNQMHGLMCVCSFRQIFDKAGLSQF